MNTRQKLSELCAELGERDTSAMGFSLRIAWNGRTVLAAIASRVMVCDMVEEFFTGNFNGTEFRQWAETHVRSSVLLRELDGMTARRKTIRWDDDGATGSAVAVIGRFAD